MELRAIEVAYSFTGEEIMASRRIRITTLAGTLLNECVVETDDPERLKSVLRFLLGSNKNACRFVVEEGEELHPTSGHMTRSEG